MNLNRKAKEPKNGLLYTAFSCRVSIALPASEQKDLSNLHQSAFEHGRRNR